MRWFTAVAVGLAALIVAPISAIGEQPVAPVVPPQVQPVEPKLRHGCETLVTQAEHHKYAQAVYQRARISRAARKKLERLRVCQHSGKAQRNTHRAERQFAHQRRVRALMYCGTPACNRRLGIHMADQRYGPGAGACLDRFIPHESGWHHRKGYGGYIGPPGRVAWGIPQALPPQKMASAGADWATNPKTQIRWLLNYVRKYGGPCGAAAHWFANRSY